MRNISIALITIGISLNSYAITKVGNGDDGADLEKTTLVTEGVLVSTREKALNLVNNLRLKSVAGLGQLGKEIQGSKILLVTQDVKNLKDFDKGLESSEDGTKVYARTIAAPGSATRFFPSSLLLSEDQLVRLHVHEALHRALAPQIRQDESAVSEITLAITDDDASVDSIAAVVEKYQVRIQNEKLSPGNRVQPGDSFAGRLLSKFNEDPYTEKIQRPSHVGYSYTSFQVRPEDKKLKYVESLQKIESFLHPFGSTNDAFGLGLGFLLVDIGDRTVTGPLQIQLNYLAATWREFDIKLFGLASLNASSAEELKSLPQIRDTVTVGLTMSRDANHFYTDNHVAITGESSSNYELGGVNYKQTYGQILDTKVGFGVKWQGFFAGLRGNFILSDGYSVRSASGSFNQEPERVRIVKFGPEVGYRYGGLRAQIAFASVIDSTPGYDLSDLADINGQGAGQSYAQGGVSYEF